MSNVKVVAKNESGSIFIVALPDALVGIFTPAVIYSPDQGTWSKPQFLGSIIKFVPIIVKEYDDQLVVPGFVITRLNNFNAGRKYR